jgi:hypothetical protein
VPGSIRLSRGWAVRADLISRRKRPAHILQRWAASDTFWCYRPSQDDVLKVTRNKLKTAFYDLFYPIIRLHFRGRSWSSCSSTALQIYIKKKWPQYLHLTYEIKVAMASAVYRCNSNRGERWCDHCYCKWGELLGRVNSFGSSVRWRTNECAPIIPWKFYRRLTMLCERIIWNLWLTTDTLHWSLLFRPCEIRWRYRNPSVSDYSLIWFSKHSIALSIVITMRDRAIMIYERRRSYNPKSISYRNNNNGRIIIRYYCNTSVSDEDGSGKFIPSYKAYYLPKCLQWRSFPFHIILTATVARTAGRLSATRNLARTLMPTIDYHV